MCTLDQLSALPNLVDLTFGCMFLALEEDFDFVAMGTQFPSLRRLVINRWKSNFCYQSATQSLFKYLASQTSLTTLGIHMFDWDYIRPQRTQVMAFHNEIASILPGKPMISKIKISHFIPVPNTVKSLSINAIREASVPLFIDYLSYRSTITHLETRFLPDDFDHSQLAACTSLQTLGVVLYTGDPIYPCSSFQHLTKFFSLTSITTLIVHSPQEKLNNLLKLPPPPNFQISRVTRGKEYGCDPKVVYRKLSTTNK
eukprot:gene5943-6882_t